jgi:hypothetical protein
MIGASRYVSLGALCHTSHAVDTVGCFLRGHSLKPCKGEADLDYFPPCIVQCYF